MSYTIERLAHSLTKLTPELVPERALHSARLCLLDCLGAAAAGRRHEAVPLAETWAESVFSLGETPVWFSPAQYSVLAAGYVNSFAASVLDIDDGHRMASGHPGAAVVPAVLAAASLAPRSFSEILTAIVCGYDAGVGIAAARDPKQLPSVATGRWSAVAAAAAAGRVLNLSSDELAEALAIAESLASNLLAADHAGFAGGHVKEGIPWSVVVGLSAVGQARAGLKGYRTTLDNLAVYQVRAEPAGHQGRFWVETTYFKRYSCCRWFHGAIDAALDLRARGLTAEQVQHIEIATFTRAAALQNDPRPTDLIGAQFSIPFSVAAAIIAGPEALLPMSSELIGRTDIEALASRVRIRVDAQLDSVFPTQAGARIAVKTEGGVHTLEVLSPRGDPSTPLTNDELFAKAVRLMGPNQEAAAASCSMLLNEDPRSKKPIMTVIGPLIARQLSN